MKMQYRITKYNLQYRNPQGCYLLDDWTEFSDIGKTFNNKKLTFDEYLKVENAYIITAISVLNQSNIDYMLVNNASSISEHYQIYENQIVSISNIEDVIRNILRNNYWCKLENKDCFIHFGYDYYMYIGCNLSEQEIYTIVKNNGLYYEIFNSPY